MAQGGATKIKCNKHLILKDRENHIFLDPLLCRARDGSCKALTLFISRSSSLNLDIEIDILNYISHWPLVCYDYVQAGFIRIGKKQAETNAYAKTHRLGAKRQYVEIIGKCPNDR